jgi:homospermidine synthase
MKKLDFQGRILVLGCGGVSRCMLPLLLRHVNVPPEKITVVDLEDNRADIPDELAAGVRFILEQIKPETYNQQLARYAGRGDLIIDLTWNLYTRAMLQWCHDNGVLYINTSVEDWDPYADLEKKETTELTLYHRQMDLRRMVSHWGGNKGPTAVIEHGANPGLVSHFTKVALLDIGHKIVTVKPADPRRSALEDAMASQKFNKVAQLVGVKVIHISERDTQITRQPKEVDEFVNTWSVEGFYEEGIAPAEMGWGTHERELPPDARLHHSGPRNQICLNTYGMNTWVRSWVPCGEIVGMVIRHGEAFSISDYLTVHGEDGSPVYRPTVHYAYCPCDAALASLHEVRMKNYEMQENWRIMGDDIVSGRDELGCLLMGHDFKSWWVGSVLDIEETRRLVPHQNATTLQVAASVLGAIFWMIRNPERGLNLPDQLPHEEILEVVRPYLGPLISKPVDWSPANYLDTAGSYQSGRPRSEEDIWQFKHFLVEGSSGP